MITKRKVAMPPPRPGQHGAEIIKRLERNVNGNRRAWQVFADFCEIAERCLIDQPAHIENAAAGLPIVENAETVAVWEKLFQWYPKHREDYWQNFTECYILLVDAADNAQRIDSSWDVLGEVFMDFGAPSAWHGQFFTPWEVARMTAQITHDDSLLHTRLLEAARRVSKAGGLDGALLDSMALLSLGASGESLQAKQSDWFNRWFLPRVAPHVEPVMVYDCACGSGVMLMASASQQPTWANQWGLVRYYGQDIDAQCVQMARINMMLHGLNGYALKCDRALLRGNLRKQGIDPDAQGAMPVLAPIQSAEHSPILPAAPAMNTNGGQPARVDVEVNWANAAQLNLFA